MLSCKEVTLLLSESLEHPLPLRRRISIRLHLMMCDFCTYYRQSLRFLEKITNRYYTSKSEEDQQLLDSLSDATKKRIEATIASRLKDRQE